MKKIKVVGGIFFSLAVAAFLLLYFGSRSITIRVSEHNNEIMVGAMALILVSWVGSGMLAIIVALSKNRSNRKAVWLYLSPVVIVCLLLFLVFCPPPRMGPIFIGVPKTVEPSR